MAWNIFYSRICSQSMHLLRWHFGFLSLVGKFGSKPKFPKKNGPWNWGMDFLVALNTKHEFSCCSKYHSISFLEAINTIGMGFLVALITHRMDLFVAVKRESTWTYSPNANLLWNPDSAPLVTPRTKFKSHGSISQAW